MSLSVSFPLSLCPVQASVSERRGDPVCYHAMSIQAFVFEANVGEFRDALLPGLESLEPLTEEEASTGPQPVTITPLSSSLLSQPLRGAS